MRRREGPTRPTDRYARIDTGLRVIRELSWSRWSVRDLGGYLGLSYRSVYRLLHAIERGGIPLRRSQDGRYVRYSVHPTDVRRAVGLCPACGLSAKKGRQLCEDCAELQARRVKALHDKRLALSLCSACGNRPAREGRQLCERCAKTHARAVRRYQERQRKQGRCELCGADSGGKMRCAVHRKKKR